MFSFKKYNHRHGFDGKIIREHDIFEDLYFIFLKIISFDNENLLSILSKDSLYIDWFIWSS